MEEEEEFSARRPIATRSRKWVHRFATILANLGITPNQVSVSSLLFAGLGAVCFVLSNYSSWWFVGAAIGIQLRLLANLMDGILAVEGGMSSSDGELFNEIPDRFSDVFLLAAAGYASDSSWGVAMGWIASCAALLTAYLRVQGASLRAGRHDFCGPFAKPQRMFLLTLLSLASAGSWISIDLLLWGLGFIAVGTFFTAFRRIYRLSEALKASS